MTMTFALNQFTTKQLSFEQDIELCESLGIHEIELCEAKLGDEMVLRKQRLALLADSSIRPVSVQSRVHSIFPDRMAPLPKAFNERIESICQCMELVHMFFPQPGLPMVVITGAAPNDNFRKGYATTRKAIEQLAIRATEIGYHIALEPIHPYLMQRDTFISTWKEALRLIHDIDRENVSLVADVWHLWQEDRIEKVLEQTARRISVVHISDWPTGGPRALDDRSIPGDGAIPLQKMLAALAAGGYEGPCCLELLSDESLPDSLWKMDASDVVQRSRDALQSILTNL